MPASPTSPAVRDFPAAFTRRAVPFLNRSPGRLLVPALPIAGLLALTVVIFGRQLFDHWSFPWDFIGTYTATPPFVANTIGSGHFVSWSPFVASGFPVDMNPQAGIYFPVWWVFGALGIPLTLGTLTSIQVAHVLFGALGVFMFARARRLPLMWASVAAVAYLFFGGFYAQAEHADYFRGFAYLPWILWSLTPPAEGGRWTRLLALPVMAWLVVAGAYPGQLAAFGIVGVIYVAISLRLGSPVIRRRYRFALVLAGVATAGACIAVVLPYLLGDHSHELYRITPPTYSLRAAESTRAIDFLGLYLSNFGWSYDGTIAAWAITVPIVLGLALVRMNVLRRHLALVIAGIVAVALAMTPRVAPIGKAMVALGPLFPSRFPAADYKPVVAIALIVLSVEAWRELALLGGRRVLTARGPVLSALIAGALMVAGALLAPSTYESVTRQTWLVILMIAASAALVVLRPKPVLLVCALIALIVVDGLRETRDYRLLSKISTWQTPPAAVAQYRARDWYVQRLSTLLFRTVATRPARAKPYASFASAPGGSPPDAAGWVADGYRLNDYGGNVQRSLWQAEHNSAWLALLLKPWHAYVFPCTTTGCGSGAVHLPAPSSWRASAAVKTLSYGVNGVVYQVHVTQPVLMVENELPLKGWKSSNSDARPVDARIPLRAWRLSPGSYTFTATYHEPGRAPQLTAVAIAILAWIGCFIVLDRVAVRQRRLREAR